MFVLLSCICNTSLHQPPQFLKCLGRLHRCLGGKAGDFPMPSLSVEAQQRLECDPEAWECRWAEQVRLTLNIMKFSHD